MIKTKQKNILLAILSFMMVLFMSVGIATSVAKAAVFTNNLFYTIGISLENNKSLTQDSRKGTSVSPLRNGSYFRIDRELVGLTSLEFGTDMDGFIISFNDDTNAVDVEFATIDEQFVATVIEEGKIKGEAVIADAVNIDLAFDANAKTVSVGGAKVCDVQAIMPTYNLVCTFNDVEDSENMVVYAINDHTLVQPVMTNKSGPTIFADFSVKGVVNNFYTIPVPYGCDLLDGAIENFEVEVKKDSTVIVEKTEYSQTLGFTPSAVGTYTITYYAKDSNAVESSQSFELTVLSLLNFEQTKFDFSEVLENTELGVNSSIIVPSCLITSQSISEFTYKPLLTVKKDGVVLENYNGVEIGSEEKFVFDKTGEYEFIYKASDKNVIGEKTFVISIVNDLPAINMPVFREYYLAGEVVALPSATMTLNGKTVNAKTIVNYPASKKAVVSSVANLNEVGVYKIEYRATIDGEMYVYNKEFMVYERAYDVNDGSASYAKSNIEKDVSGVMVKLSSASSFTLNQPIDLTGKKAGQSVLTVDILPSTQGTIDFVQLNVRFTDIHDPENYVTISCRKSRDEQDLQLMSYVKAGYKNQAQVGLEGGSKPYFEPSEWGEYISVTFNGSKNPVSGDINNSFEVSFDYDNRVIYANGKQIVALNNPLYFADLWEGFTTGECYVTLSAQELMGMEATVLVTKAGDVDLSKEYIKDDLAPEITVDTDYSLNELPSAIVGEPYKVFDASAFDMESGNVKVISSVYYAYTSSSKGQIDIVDGAFTPFIQGRYTIEYKAIDDSGNVGIKTLSVFAYNSLDSMSISVQTAPSGNWLVGHEVSVANYSITNPNGIPNVEIIAKNKATNTEFLVENYKFIPTEYGQFEIIYTATDYVGRVAQDKYEITIGSDGLAVFKGEVELPFVMIQGQKYTLPGLKAYTYETGEKEVDAKIFVKDANGTHEVNGDYTPVVATSGDNIEVIYKVTTSSGDTTKSYFVPVKRIKTGASYDLTQYFLGDVSVTADENNVYLTTTSDQTVKFINPLIVNNFNLDFSSNVAKNAFDRIDIYLTDMLNEDVRVKFSYIKGANGKTEMSINDSVAVETSSSFVNEASTRFVLTYDHVEHRLSDILGLGLKIKDTVNGQAFNGFPSGRVYFEIKFTGVSGESQIKINSINTQKFTNRPMDATRPQVVINGTLGGSYEVGSTYVIPIAYALDVLDPTVIFTMTATMPGGNIVTDTNGVELSGVDPTVSRSIVLEKPGTYTFAYTAKDTSNRTYPFSTVINVIDKIAPTITIDGQVESTAKFDSTITLPKATAYKNGEVYTRYNNVLGVDEPVNVVVFVVCPNTRREVAKMSETSGKYTYKFTQKGEHTVVYVVYDESGNSAEHRFTVKVS